MLQLRNVKKLYNECLVLDVPDLSLQKGIYWVKGANGSGKTTLLKMIAGLLPFSGNILWENISLLQQPLLYRRQVAWAEAEPLFPSFISGTDLIRLYCNIRKVQIRSVNPLLELLDMSAFIGNKLGTYSAGMTKKLSLVLAFVGDPSLIVLDEPLITLDSQSLFSISNFIIEKHRNNTTTFLLSSHQEIDSALMQSGRQLLVNNRTVSYADELSR